MTFSIDHHRPTKELIAVSYLFHSYQIGDWVSGTSLKDERFRGYIEDIHDTGYATIRIIESDNEKAIGKTSKSHLNRLKKLEMTPFQSIGQIYNLIDLALVNKDKEWFMELTTQLKQLQEKQNQLNKQQKQSLPTKRWSL